MAVNNQNKLYEEEQLRKKNNNVANQTLASLQQNQAQGAALPAASLPQAQQNAQVNLQQQPQAINRQNAGINTQYGYTPSQSVLDAYDYLQSVIGSKPGEYKSRNTDQLQGLLDQIMNREPFQYDAYADPLYQIYQDMYMQNGKRAMQDAMGQAAAMTGGYGSSYAQGVGQQTYNQYMENLMGVIPELSQMAYSRYRDEGEDLQRNYEILSAQEAQDYGRYRDLLSDWQAERQLAENTLGAERGFDYAAFSEKSARDMQEDQFAKQLALHDAQLQLQRDQFEWQKAQAAAKASGGGGGDAKKQTQTQTQTAEEIQKNSSLFIASLYTPNEYAKRGIAKKNGENYESYVAGKVQTALNNGKLSNNEALAVLDYYSKRK